MSLSTLLDFFEFFFVKFFFCEIIFENCSELLFITELVFFRKSRVKLAKRNWGRAIIFRRL